MMMNTLPDKKEYIAEQKRIYKRMKKAEKLSKELETRIAEIRGMGYKLIVLGNKVKIT